eukprot:1033414-Pelagomonas_calceolata.AAC.7
MFRRTAVSCLQPGSRAVCLRCAPRAAPFWQESVLLYSSGHKLSNTLFWEPFLTVLVGVRCMPHCPDRTAL